jgi:CheY-like chemotaxis protein
MLRTSELERAQETLIHSEKMSAVGQLVAGVAHELNNPLTVVLGYSGLMLEQATDPALRRKLEALHHAAESSRKIVQNLLAFARKQKVEKSMTDVNDVIVRTVELRAYHLRSEAIEVHYDLQPDLPPTWADQHQLQQVVLNLVVNAEQAIQDSGKGSVLRLATRRVAEGIEIELEDDGPGIPPEVRTRIFEPFFTTKDVGRGTGLGLSICFGIIADHGGSIQVESEPGRWTRFRITLPLSEARATSRGSHTAAAGPAPPDTPSLHILVVDDDPGVLRFVEDAFDGEPVVVDKARGGSDAIRSLSTGRVYDAILSDLRMPGVDGREVHRFVRESRPELASRLILATGDMANLDSLSFMDRANCVILEKPFTVASLRAAVRRVSRR